MTLRLAAGTREYVRAAVAATEDGVAVNPTSNLVQFAFRAPGATPVEADWKTGEWETSGGTYYARILLGLGGTIELAAGVYEVWLRVTDSPERPVRRVDTVLVY